MKKYMPVLLAIVIGIIFGNLIFDSYETQTVMASDGSVYMLQYGAYVSESVMKESVKNLDKKIYVTENENDVYYVYLGFTTNYYNAMHLVEIYKEQGIHLYIKEKYLGNSNLINKIKEIDNLMKDEEDLDLIMEYVIKVLNLYKNYYY